MRLICCYPSGGDVGEQRIRHRLAVATQGLERAAEIDRSLFAGRIAIALLMQPLPASWFSPRWRRAPLIVAFGAPAAHGIPQVDSAKLRGLHSLLGMADASSRQGRPSRRAERRSRRRVSSSDGSLLGFCAVHSGKVWRPTAMKRSVAIGFAFERPP